MRLSSSLALVASFQFGVSGYFDCHVYAVRGPAGIVLIDAGAGTHTDVVLANFQAASQFSRKTWGLLSLELWHQRFHDRAIEFKAMAGTESGTGFP